MKWNLVTELNENHQNVFETIRRLIWKRIVRMNKLPLLPLLLFFNIVDKV